MIVVGPLRDELAQGHEARRRRFVGTLYPRRHFHQMCAQLGASHPQGLERIPKLNLLAQISGMSSAEYARRHSLLPAARVASRSRWRAEYGAHCKEMDELSRIMGMKSLRGGAFVCNDCIDSDLASLGISWYKRAHHLPGMDWCPIHGGQLFQVDASAPFDDLPNVHRERGRLVMIDCAMTRLPECGWLRRYVDILVSFLSRSRPIACEVLNDKLSAKARSLGLRVSNNDRGLRPYLSDYLSEFVDSGWLMRVAPIFGDNRPGKVLSRLDMVVVNRTIAGTGDAYAMVLATICGTSDEAFALLKSASEECIARTERGKMLRSANAA